jgi:dihydrofolate reductase
MTALLSIITAFDRNRLIGRDNELPWHLPADLQFFKQTTMGKPIIMGRMTFESIGRPLPGRRNLVISRNAEFNATGCEVYPSVERALASVSDLPEAMLIGGASLYAQTLDQASTLYTTQIDAEFEGDAWFPEISADDWLEVWRKNHGPDEHNPYAYAFVKYSRAGVSNQHLGKSGTIS